MKKLVYDGNESEFELMFEHLKKRLPTKEIGIYQDKNNNQIYKIYLIDAVGMEIRYLGNVSNLCVDDYCSINLIGSEEKIDKIEKIIKEYYSKK